MGIKHGHHWVSTVVTTTGTGNEMVTRLGQQICEDTGNKVGLGVQAPTDQPVGVPGAALSSHVFHLHNITL